MRRVWHIPLLVLAHWAAWLAMLLFVYVQHRLSVIHPHFLPVTILLTVQVSAGIALVACGLWRLARRPQRLRTAAWILLGTFPLWLSLTYGLYLLWSVGNRDLAIRKHGLDVFAVMAGAGLADLEARFRYSHRIEGRYTVMWTDHAPGGERDVAAMDRHVEQLAALLGQTCRAKVHWMRGGLLGQHGRYWEGISLGSRRGDSSGSLKNLDQHEVAHFVIEHLCGPDADPPTLLIEGWAEAQSGYEPGMQAWQAWRQKHDGGAFTLRELVSDQWYDRFLPPVYEQGGPLVEYILRTYGGERFFGLYSTCRRETFAQDCRRILGVSLDELDRAYWADVERQVTAADHVDRYHPLFSVKLADGIDPAQWRYVATEHWKAYERAREQLRRAKASYSIRSEIREGDLRRAVYTYRSNVKQDWPRVRAVNRAEGEKGATEQVAVADPRHSFRLSKREEESEWTPARIGETGIAKYDMIIAWDRTGRVTDLLSHAFRTHWNEFAFADKDSLVTGVEQVERDGEHFWRIGYETTVPLGFVERRAGWFLLAPDRNWTIQEEQFTATREDQPPYSRHKTVEYGPPRDGLPMLRTVHEVTRGAEDRQWTLRVESIEFGPTPLEEFTPEAFGISVEELPAASPVPLSVLITAIGSAVSLPGSLLLFGASVWLRRTLVDADDQPTEVPLQP